MEGWWHTARALFSSCSARFRCLCLSDVDIESLTWIAFATMYRGVWLGPWSNVKMLECGVVISRRSVPYFERLNCMSCGWSSFGKSQRNFTVLSFSEVTCIERLMRGQAKCPRVFCSFFAQLMLVEPAGSLVPETNPFSWSDAPEDAMPNVLAVINQ